MPLTIVMQELTTVTLNTSGQIITQQENLWPDLGPYQDMAVFAYFAQVPSSFTGSPALYIQTAPLKEGVEIQPRHQTIVTLDSSPTVTWSWGR